MNLLGFGKAPLVGFSDPFKSDKITAIRIRKTERWLSGGFHPWQADVDFKNGNTTGSQSFENEDFAALVAEIEGFIKAL